MRARLPDCCSVHTTQELSQERVTLEHISFRSPLKNINKSACGCGTKILPFDSAHILFRMRIFVIVCFRLTLFRLTNQTSNQIINNCVLLLYIPYRLFLLFILCLYAIFLAKLRTSSFPSPLPFFKTPLKVWTMYGPMAKWIWPYVPANHKVASRDCSNESCDRPKTGGWGWWLFLGLFKVGGGVGGDGNLKSNKWFNCGMYQNLL